MTPHVPGPAERARQRAADLLRAAHAAIEKLDRARVPPTDPHRRAAEAERDALFRRHVDLIYARDFVAPTFVTRFPFCCAPDDQPTEMPPGPPAAE